MSVQAQLIFTPRVSGKVTVDCDFQAQGGGSGYTDWSSSYQAVAFLMQNGTTTYGDVKPLQYTRNSYRVQGVFTCDAFAEVTCGVEFRCSGTTTITGFGITIRAHMTVRS